MVTWPAAVGPCHPSVTASTQVTRLPLSRPVDKWQGVSGRLPLAHLVIQRRYKHCQSWSKSPSLSVCLKLELFNDSRHTHVFSCIEWGANTLKGNVVDYLMHCCNISEDSEELCLGISLFWPPVPHPNVGPLECTWNLIVVMLMIVMIVMMGPVIVRKFRSQLVTAEVRIQTPGSPS